MSIEEQIAYVRHRISLLNQCLRLCEFRHPTHELDIKQEIHTNNEILKTLKQVKENAQTATPKS